MKRKVMFCIGLLLIAGFCFMFATTLPAELCWYIDNASIIFAILPLLGGYLINFPQVSLKKILKYYFSPTIAINKSEANLFKEISVFFEEYAFFGGKLAILSSLVHYLHAPDFSKIGPAVKLILLTHLYCTIFFYVIAKPLKRRSALRPLDPSTDVKRENGAKAERDMNDADAKNDAGSCEGK